MVCSDITNNHRVQNQMGVKVYAINEKPIYRYGYEIRIANKNYKSDKWSLRKPANKAQLKATKEVMKIGQGRITNKLKTAMQQQLESLID